MLEVTVALAGGKHLFGEDGAFDAADAAQLAQLWDIQLLQRKVALLGLAGGPVTDNAKGVVGAQACIFHLLASVVLDEGTWSRAIAEDQHHGFSAYFGHLDLVA
ncbi:MAG: hypothetical protein ACPIOQ_02170 [Promethearchaeia archaeon]